MGYNYPIPDEIKRYKGMGGGGDYSMDKYNQPGWPTGDRVTRQDATQVVHTADEFRSAVMGASDNEVIWIPGDAQIDVTGMDNIVVSNSITIASDRGYTGNGALIYSKDSPIPFLNIQAAGARVTSVQFLGPVTTSEEYSWDKEGNAVSIKADQVEIDNCVFRGFGYAGVEVGRQAVVEKPHIHHNRFVDNPLQELGYGVVIRHGKALIEGNYFDDNRHAVSSSGAKDGAYIARNNFCGPHTVLQTFDVHAANESGVSNHDWAGKSFEIIGNVILADTELNGHAATGIFIRGDPLEKSIIAENQFAHKPEVDDNPGFGVGSWGDAYALNVSSIADSNIVVGENYYNTTSPSPIPDF